MGHIRCQQCNTIYDVSHVDTSVSFACTCGAQVNPADPRLAVSTGASIGSDGADFFSTGGGVPPTGSPGMSVQPQGGHRRLVTGSLIRDRYRVEGLLGEGGMGEVYLVHDQMLQEDKAMKLLHPGLDEVWRAKLVEELRMQQQLSHEGILRSYDLDIDPATGRYFFTMEYINGPSLETLLQEAGQQQRRPPFSLEQVSEFLAHLTDALGYAHAKKIVHRDLKPSNILMPHSGGIKLLDFGIARQVGEGAQHTGLVGTAIYMAPEQMRGGGEISGAADVYSVGVILYQMLTGELFYGRMPGPSELLGTYGVKAPFPEALDDVVLQSLEAIPSRRYATIDALCDAFEAACQGSGNAQGSTSQSRQSRAKKQFWKQAPEPPPPPDWEEPPMSASLRGPRLQNPAASIAAAVPYYNEETEKIGAWKAIAWGCLSGLGVAIVMGMLYGMVTNAVGHPHRYNSSLIGVLSIIMSLLGGLGCSWLYKRMDGAVQRRFSAGVREAIIAGWIGGIIGFVSGIGSKGASGGMGLLAGGMAAWFIRLQWFKQKYKNPKIAWTSFGFLIGLLVIMLEDGRLGVYSLIGGTLTGFLCGLVLTNELSPRSKNEVILEEV